MTATKLTKSATEADLEARIHSALRIVFPWLPSSAIRHQTKFSFKIGHAEIQMGGAKDAKVEGRADILVEWGDEPIAVLELKRAGLPLTDSDVLQGLSYANVVMPRYPLVVVTNGTDTRVLQSYDGKELTPTIDSAQELRSIVAAAANAATNDLKRAISILMGSHPAIWMQAIKSTSADFVRERTGPWSDTNRPFINDFLIPRTVCSSIETALKSGKRLILVEGAPLSGKSSLIRELVQRTADSNELAVLFVPSDYGHGLLQIIANSVNAALSWNVTESEAKVWLQQLSRSNGPSLVVAIDGVNPEHEQVRRDIEDLSSTAFGDRLKLLVTTDDANSGGLRSHRSGRQASTIELRIDASFRLELLDLDEYRLAQQELLRHRMGIMYGGHTASEYRVPWVLRAMGRHYSPDPDDHPNHIAALPAQLSLDLIDHVRETSFDNELRRLYQGVAQAVLKDVTTASSRSATLALEGTESFLTFRTTLREFLELSEIQYLIDHGYLRQLSRSGDWIVFVRLPELVASETSRVLASELRIRSLISATEAANWMVDATARIPIGDVIAGHAFLDLAADANGRFPKDLIEALLRRPPKREPIAPGTEVLMMAPGIGPVRAKFRDDDSMVVKLRGRDLVIDGLKEAGESTMVGDYQPWLVLSHIAGKHMVIESEGGALRVEPTLLLTVGSCRHLLRRPDRHDADGRGIATIDLPEGGVAALPSNGIAEPITASLVKFLASGGHWLDDWIREAVEMNSTALLFRLLIALVQVRDLADPEVRAWAKRAIEEHVEPALRRSMAID